MICRQCPRCGVSWYSARHISRYKKQIYKQNRKRGEIGWDEN